MSKVSQRRMSKTELEMNGLDCCPLCGKKVRETGVSNHVRDAHGETLEAWNKRMMPQEGK